MLGSELKKKRLKSGLSIYELAELLECVPSNISHMEKGISKIPKKTEKRINNVISEEYSLGVTNKVFSRDKFLKGMLTGNSVIDEIYIEANWLKNMDKKPVYSKSEYKSTNLGNYSIERTSTISKQYVILDTTLFYCKEEWIK